MLTPLLLKLLLLTRQAAEHGAVEPRRNELPSFRARRGLSIVPIQRSGRHWIEKKGGGNTLRVHNKKVVGTIPCFLEITDYEKAFLHVAFNSFSPKSVFNKQAQQIEHTFESVLAIHNNFESVLLQQNTFEIYLLGLFTQNTCVI